MVETISKIVNIKKQTEMIKMVNEKRLMGPNGNTL